MSTELTNLLPSERKQALNREYLFRVGTIAFAALGFLAIIHGVLLFSSYAYVLDQQEVQKKRLETLTAERAASGFSDLSARVSAFSQKALKLEELSSLPTGSATVRSILELSRTGITLTSFSYTPPVGSGKGQMTLIGTAATREALRSFDGALNGLSFVSAADLPLSAYAKESDIPFTIALTLDFSTP